MAPIASTAHLQVDKAGRSAFPDVEKPIGPVASNDAERGLKKDAENEPQMAERCLEAARYPSVHTQSVQLQYLTALRTIGGDRSSMMVFPLRITMMKALTETKSNG